MKIGTFITIFNDKWDKIYKPLFDFDLDHFELLPENSKVYSRSKLKKLLGKKEVIFHAPFIESNFIANDKCFRKAAGRYLDSLLIKLIKDFSPKVITTHLGFTAFIYQNLEFDEFKKLLKKYPQISVENMPKLGNIWREPYPNSEIEMDFVIDKLKCNIVFDVGHWLKQGFDVYRLVEKYYSKIVNIHIHDVVNGKDHQALGTGILDVERFINILKKRGYKKYLTIELAHDDIKGVISSFKVLKKIIK